MPAKSVPPPVEDAELERLIRHYGDCCYSADDAEGLPSNGVVEAEAALRSYVSAKTVTRDEAECLMWELDRDEDHPYFTAHGYAALLEKLQGIRADSAMRESPQDV